MMKKLGLLIACCVLFTTIGVGTIDARVPLDPNVKDAVEWFTHREFEGFDYLVLPTLRYNPIEHLRGGFVYIYDTHPDDQFKIFGDISFTKGSVHGGAVYKRFTAEGDNYWFVKLTDDLLHKGYADNQVIWQQEQEFSTGYRYEYLGERGFLRGSTAVKLLNLTPKGELSTTEFAPGNELLVSAVTHGMYRTYEGKLVVDYASPVAFTTFDYVKAKAYLSKGFFWNETSGFRLTGEAGILRGNYPMQAQFFLGGSPNSFPPVFIPFMREHHDGNPEAPQVPELHLSGFPKGAFAGSNMFISRLEYIHAVEGVRFDRYFLQVGDSWDEEVRTVMPKISIGLGFSSLPVQSSYLDGVDEINAINIMYGFAEGGYLAIEIEKGWAFNWLGSPSETEETEEVE